MATQTPGVLAIENIAARQRAMKINSNQVKRLTADEVDQMGLPMDVALAVKSNLAVTTIITLNEQIDVLEKRLQEKIGERKEFILLSSVPGIGRILATIILLEMGPVDRFAEVGNFASYARCVDSQHTSNGKKKGEGNTKNGNKYLAWAFVEAANPSTGSGQASHCVSMPRPNDFTSARKRRQIRRLPPRRWHTSLS